MLISPLQRFPLLFAGGALLAALTIAPLSGGAAPLSQEECEQLRVEKKSLVGQGVEKEMAKGPEWVKANIKAPQLDLIKRYLTVDEQLKFRCLTGHKPRKGSAAARIAARKAAAKARRAGAAKSGAKPASANGKRSGGTGD